MQLWGVYILLSAKRGACFCKDYHNRNGRCIAILFKSIGVRGRFDSPDTDCCCRQEMAGISRDLGLERPRIWLRT